MPVSCVTNCVTIVALACGKWAGRSRTSATAGGNWSVAFPRNSLSSTGVVKQLSDQLEACWRGLRDGQSAEACIRFEAAQKRAKTLGLPHRTVPEISTGDFEDFAVLHLTELIGDKALRDISRTDTMRDRTWWRDRVTDESIEIGAANKSIGQVAKMYKEVRKAHQLSLPPVSADLTLEGEVDKQRAAFEPDFVENRIVASGVLDELNDEVRDLVYVIADGGMRLSEAANLLPDASFLDAPVPYVRIKADGRQLKTLHSDREIPLVGLATQALQTHCNTLRPPGRIPPKLPAIRRRTAVDALNVASA